MLSGQTPGAGKTTPTPGAGTTTPTSPTRTTTTTRSPTDQQSSTEFQRPLYVTGRVMLDDGTPLPEPVVIVLVCSGTVRPQGRTSAKGHFSISLGQDQSMLPDASMGSGVGMDPFGGSGASRPGQGMTERQLMGCELRADLPGFRSDAVQMSGRRAMDSPDVGTLVLHRLANVAGFTYSMTSAAAPKDAQKAFEKGQNLLKKKKFEEAEVNLRRAVDVYPKYAAAWYGLGEALEAQKKVEEAGQAYQQSLAADAKFVSPHLALLQQAVNGRDWKLIAERSDAVIKLNPFNYPMAWFLSGAAHYNLKEPEAAEKSAREAVKLDPDHRNPRALQLLGVILSDKGDYTGALEQMRGYLSFAAHAPDIESVRRQVAELERVSGVKATAQAPDKP